MKQTVILLIFISLDFSSFSQDMDYIKAGNCDCYLYTVPANVASLKWFGNCTNGYCGGYGTAIYYDRYGNFFLKYIGNVSNGKRQGFGTDYYSDGSTHFQGNFDEGKLVSAAPFAIMEAPIGDFIIDSLFDGGINRYCELTEAAFSSDNAMQEIRYKISFDGNIISTNHYACTLVIKNTTPYVDFVDYNDNAGAYLTYKMAQFAYKIANWLSQNGDKKNDN